MFEALKMFIGFLFSVGLLGFTICNRKAYDLKGNILVYIALSISAVIFLGQLISKF